MAEVLPLVQEVVAKVSRMSLKDSLEQAKPHRKECKFSILIASMDAEDREAFDTAFENYTLYTSAGLARILRNEGFDMSENMIRFHRRKDCKFCYGSEG